MAAVNEFDPRHSHEPGIEPVFDREGRCLVCGVLVGLERLERLEAKVDGLTGTLEVLLERFGPMLERAEARFNRAPMFGAGRRGQNV